MAVKIRLKRMGAKKTPFYRIVVSDSRSPRDGRFIEEIGYYNPLTNPADIKVNLDRANYWISCGAQPSDTVRALIKKSAARADKEAQAAAAPAPAPEATEQAPEPTGAENISAPAQDEAPAPAATEAAAPEEPAAQAEI